MLPLTGGRNWKHILSDFSLLCSFRMMSCVFPFAHTSWICSFFQLKAAINQSTEMHCKWLPKNSFFHSYIWQEVLVEALFMLSADLVNPQINYGLQCLGSLLMHVGFNAILWCIVQQISVFLGIMQEPCGLCGLSRAQFLQSVELFWEKGNVELWKSSGWLRIR